MPHLVIFQLRHQHGITPEVKYHLAHHNIITPVMRTNTIADYQSEGLQFTADKFKPSHFIQIDCNCVAKLLGFLLSWQILFVKPRLILVVAKFIVQF